MSREGIMILILIGAICIMAMKIKKLNDTIKKVRENALTLSSDQVDMMGLILELKTELDTINK